MKMNLMNRISRTSLRIPAAVCALATFLVSGPALHAAGTLQAYYSFEEGAGATSADTTGNHGTAALVEDYAWSGVTPGALGHSTQSIDVQANNAERGGAILPGSVSTGVLEAGAFSVSLWARSHRLLDGNPPGGSRVLLAKRNTGVGWPDADWYYQIHQSDHDTGEMIGVDFGGNMDFPQTVTENAWHHYVFTHDGANSWTVFVDGAGSTMTTPNNPSNVGNDGWPLHVGWDGNQLNDAVADPDTEIGKGKWHWNGEIDDLAIFSGELDQAQVDLLGADGLVPEPSVSLLAVLSLGALLIRRRRG